MDITAIGRQNGLQTNTHQMPAHQTAHGDVNGDSGKGASQPKAYESPVVSVDSATGTTVLSFRDPGTGKQAFQVPSRTALEYERQQRLSLPQKASTGTMTA